MRWFIMLWAAPLGLFWGWFGLSYHDWNFGFVFLTRLVHDLSFQIYGHLLGIDPDTVPLLLAQASVLDTGVLLAIFAYRRRTRIAAWWRDRQAQPAGDKSQDSPALRSAM